MSEHRMVRFGVAALVIVLLLGAGAAAIQQSAWSQGYMMGLIAGNGEGDALSQYVLYNSGRSPSLGGAIGGFFKVGLLLFGFLFFAKFFFGMAHMRRWRMAGGSDGAEWHGHRHHGPPWCWPQDEAASNEPAQAQSAPESGRGAGGESAGAASVDEPVK